MLVAFPGQIEQPLVSNEENSSPGRFFKQDPEGPCTSEGLEDKMRGIYASER